MRRSATAVLVVLLLAATASAAGSFAGKVVKITDGDTIQVLRDGVPVKVRL